MNIYYVLVLVLLTIEGLCEFHKQETSVIQFKKEPGPGGLWQTKVQWKAHWVKHWETRKIWIPIWRKIWGPVEVKEWLPLPKPPPTWEPPSTWTPPHL